MGDASSDTPVLLAGAPPPCGGYDADIIILMHGRLEETIAAVESALRQQKISLHVSVLDQGSAPEVRAAFAARFRGVARFGVYAVDRNLGVGGGRNFLSGLGNGECIVALDNDAVFADELVAANAVALFGVSPALGVIGFKILARDGINLDLQSWGYPQGLLPAAHRHFTSTTFVGAGHAIRRRCWVEAGGYDADLFFAWEEYDFSLRAIRLYWRILYAGDLAVVHKVAAEARVEWAAERMRYFMRNRLLVARKWQAPWWALAPRIGFYLLKAARKGGLLPALAGWVEALQADRKLFKQRMNARMRHYVREHETQFHETALRSFYRHVVLEMRPGR